MKRRKSKSRRREEEERAQVMALPVLPVRHHATIAADSPGDELVSSSVGPQGEIVSLWTSAVATSHVTVHRGDTVTRMTLHEPPPADSIVQVLPDDRILAVADRCQLLPSGPELNATVYDAGGRIAVTGTLGDGIEHVLVSASGDIWVAYFDEGIFGNLGWGDVGAPRPLGTAGLVRFSPDLEPVWHYGGDCGPIYDCYALNVDGDIAWACYYDDFPVVRVRNGTVTCWRNTVSYGTRAVAVADPTVALFGGYAPRHDEVVIARLGRRKLRELGRYRLVLPDGSPLPEITKVVARGADLHIFADGDCYRFDLDDSPV